MQNLSASLATTPAQEKKFPSTSKTTEEPTAAFLRQTNSDNIASAKGIFRSHCKKLDTK